LPGNGTAFFESQVLQSSYFYGGVENQKILPFGTPEEVAAETRVCLKQLGPDGYIPFSCHFAQADTPVFFYEFQNAY